ncbi:hypothetical protein CCHL11_08600 [Colletotrichum chlorophyti]|uniref:2EXR domain-containing protein n=1 Tax=Colletotrichum chlorophyti TaxID=708187 RepID=A0A1Q8RCQ7_9PEZI|nr:hypothetical protein CCHL11_08600 [Colletotrichum chlorophyti]
MAASTSSDPDPLAMDLSLMDLEDSFKGPVFHLFTSLPPEVRTKIWRLAAPKPAVVERTINNTTMAYGLRRRVPALLHACRESRAELTYDPSHRTGASDGQFDLVHVSHEAKTQGKGVYLNCKEDTLLMYRAPPKAIMPDAPNFARVRNLAMEWGLRPCWVQNHCHAGVVFVKQFPALQTLTLLVSFKIYNHLPLGESGSKHREQTQKRRALGEIKGWVLDAMGAEKTADPRWCPPEVRVVPKTRYWTAPGAEMA